jgi:hypothetical protein
LSWHFADQNAEVLFVFQGYSAGSDIYRFLAHLAVAQPRVSASLIPQLQPSDDYNIVLTTQPRGGIPTALWACSYFVFLGAQQ